MIFLLDLNSVCEYLPNVLDLDPSSICRIVPAVIQDDRSFGYRISLTVCSHKDLNIKGIARYGKVLGNRLYDFCFEKLYTAVTLAARQSCLKHRENGV